MKIDPNKVIKVYPMMIREDGKEVSYQTPLEDLRRDALEHYNEVSLKAYHSMSDIPQAINFYYDYEQMSFWQKIKQAFK